MPTRLSPSPSDIRRTPWVFLPITEISYHLIDYCNALYNIYPECFTDPKGFSLLQRPGMPAMNRVFIDIYGLALQEGEVTEETMYNLLKRLIVETPNHPVP